MRPSGPAPASFRACVDSERVGGKASEMALPSPGLSNPPHQ
jgi:hypothetical protein